VTWDGTERRKVSQDLNEMIGRIDERTKNIDEKLDTHIHMYNGHVASNELDFKKAWAKQGSLDTKVAFYAGGIAVLVVLLKLVFKF